MRTLMIVATALTVVGCCCSRPCTSADPMRDIGIDLRGPTGEGSYAVPQVFIETTCAWIPAARADDVLGAWRPTDGAPVHAVPFEAADRIRRVWHTSKDIDVISAPSLVALHDQTATIFVGDALGTRPRAPGERSMDYDVEAATHALAIEITPTIPSDGPIHIEFESAFKEDAPEGQDPTTGYVTRVHSSFDTADGGYTLVGTWVPVRRAGIAYVQATLVLVRRLDPRDEAVVTLPATKDG